MKIQTLIESNEVLLYRYQRSWIDNNEPVIRMPGRNGRIAQSGRSVTAYMIHYGLTENGYKVPKRWNSSFCTTNPDKSMFFALFDVGNQGVRRVVIPLDTPCGWIENDFNEASYEHPGFMAMVMNIRRWRDTLGSLTRDDPQTYTRIKELLETATQLEYTDHTSSQGYEQFVGLVKAFDKLCEKLDVSDEFKGSNMTKELTKSLATAVRQGNIGVATAGTLPKQRNMEVWFEGPYDAVRVDAHG